MVTHCREVPYDELDTNDLLVAIENGYRLHRPPDCPEALFQIMSCCWSLHPHERPKFSEVNASLAAVENSLSTEHKPVSVVGPVQYENITLRGERLPSMHGRPQYENVDLVPAQPRHGSVVFPSDSRFGARNMHG
jgi:hypothetical protein